MKLFELSKSLQDALSTKRLVFTVTTGRSGTAYLANILSLLPNVVAYHEPEPNFVEVMRSGQADRELLNRFLLDKKLPAIASEELPIYVETSHLASKGFLEPLLDLGVIPSLILLARPHREVATSLCRLGHIPGRTELGKRWYLDPSDPGVLSLTGWNDLEDYQLCYWYCLEMERRRFHYQQIWKNQPAPVASVNLQQLTTLWGILDFLRQLRLPFPSIAAWLKMVRMRKIRVNTKMHEKSVQSAVERVDELENELVARLEQKPCETHS